MPRLIVKFPQQKSLVFPLRLGETLIGRGDDCQLRLPSVSVSRQHCRIVVGKQNINIEDLDSQNGILIQGKAAKQHTLKSGDEIQVGSFMLVYLTESNKDKFYQGRFVDYMPAYDADDLARALANMEGKATTVLGADAILRIQNENRALEHARIVSMDDPDQFWYPADKGLTFGSGGMIPVEGWFTFGTIAAVKWDGARHFLEKQAWWITASVNNQIGARLHLTHGARIRIAGSRFRYDLPPIGKN